jgi:hypothetical protein
VPPWAGLAPWPGGLELELEFDGVATSAGGVAVGAGLACPGALPLWPGAVPERPGAVALLPFVVLPCTAGVTAGATVAAFLAAPLRLPCELFAFVLAVCCVDATCGHGPTVSPWRMCAGSAFFATMIVTKGFFFECVW